MNSARWLAIGLAMVLPLGVAGAKQSPSQLIDAVTDCLDLKDNGARLACFDVKAGELKAARTKQPKTFADREIRRQAEKFQPLETTIESVTELGTGAWLFVLPDHSVWETTDIVTIVPQSGKPIRITQGMMGGFLASLGGGSSLRVKKLR